MPIIAASSKYKKLMRATAETVVTGFESSRRGFILHNNYTSVRTYYTNPTLETRASSLLKQSRITERCRSVLQASCAAQRYLSERGRVIAIEQRKPAGRRFQT